MGVAKRVGMTPQRIDEMYHLLAIANYEDCFVIPTTHRELVEDTYDLRGGGGFTDGDGCSSGQGGGKLFSGRKFRSSQEFIAWPAGHGMKTFKALSLLLGYPTAEL